MTDFTANDTATMVGQRTPSAALVARRYAAEWRFRLYGIAAIVFTTIFLVGLLADILSKGWPAFIEHRLVLPIMIDASVVDPKGVKDPKALLGADYDSLIKNALRAKFPGVTARADRKLLLGLLSSGAADDFRRMVTRDPALIGTEVQVPALLSDDADQYLKGYQTTIDRHAGAGTLSIAKQGDAYVLTSSQADFKAALAASKAFAASQLTTSSTELKRLSDALAASSSELQRAQDRLAAAQKANDTAALAIATVDLARIKGDVDALTDKQAQLKAKVDGLSARVNAPAQAEALDGFLPSVLVEADGGFFKVTELGESAVTAVAVLLPKGAATAAGQNWTIVDLAVPETNRRIEDREAIWLEQLKADGVVERGIAWRFFTSGDSREPELAGLRGAMIGTLLTLAVTLALCLPIGVGAAVYLEEFAPKNRLTGLIEININNLAAVPSIVFGLLGLAMFLNFFQLPRSAPLVGGLVLALLVLPTIIIASRAALRAVPPSIKEAALGVGASHQQAVFQHVLPLAMPGIMTGTIIGMAHALGETAPLLMIGMVAFIVDVPSGITDAATVLPVQIYLWSDLPEIAFQAKTAGTIIVLLVFLFVMNAAAIVLRKRFERRW